MIQDQQRAHAVVAEALPHLGEEERGQPARMAEEGAVERDRGGLPERCESSGSVAAPGSDMGRAYDSRAPGHAGLPSRDFGML